LLKDMKSSKLAIDCLDGFSDLDPEIFKGGTEEGGGKAKGWEGTQLYT